MGIAVYSNSKAGDVAHFETHIATPTASRAESQGLTPEQRARTENNRRMALQKRWNLEGAKNAYKDGKLNTWEIQFYEDVFNKLGTVLSQREAMLTPRPNLG